MRTTMRTGSPGLRARVALLAVLAAGCAPQVSSTEHLRAAGVEPSAAQLAWLAEVCASWLEPLRAPYPAPISETELVGWELDRYRQAAAALRRALAGPSPFPATREALAAALEPLAELDGDGPAVLAAVERQAEDVFAAAVEEDVAFFDAVESCAGAPWGVEPPTAEEIATGVARALQLEAEDGERSPRSETLVADLFDGVVDATVTPTAAFELDGRLQVHLPYEDDAWWCVTVPDHAELDAVVVLAPGRC
jgi:hypothetical protein